LMRGAILIMGSGLRAASGQLLCETDDEAVGPKFGWSCSKEPVADGI
jgi:hypothetical protein